MSPRPRLDHVRRPELLAAAAAVIRQRGLENARVADVAEEAGTSAPSVLYYFASKAELLKEALTSAEERFYEELALELEGIESAARAARSRSSTPAAGEGDYDAALWMELWARALRDPELAATRAELDGRWRRSIAEVVRYGQERGEFGPADPEEFAVLLASPARRAGRADRAEGHGGHTRPRAGAGPETGRARARLRAARGGTMLSGRGMDRRELLLAGAGLALAGCGVGDSGSGSKEDTEKVVKAKVDGDLVYFNWSEYLDPELIKDVREAVRRQGAPVELRLDVGDAGEAPLGQPLRHHLPGPVRHAAAGRRATSC